MKKAERALQKLQKNLEPAELPTDLETLTSEERFLFRKMGLSMKPFLVLGNRVLLQPSSLLSRVEHVTQFCYVCIQGGERFLMAPYKTFIYTGSTGSW